MPAVRGRWTSSVAPSTVPTAIIGTRRVHSARTAPRGFSIPTRSALTRSVSAKSASANLSGTKCVASGMVTSAEPKPVMPKISAPRKAMPASAAVSPGSIKSGLDRRVERVATGQLRRAEHVRLDRLEDIGTAKAFVHRAPLHAKRVEREDVVMDDGVVPRRAGTVVAVVVAGHVLVAAEPGGVVVDALARAARRVGPRLAARGDRARELALPDRSPVGLQVDQHPVEEVDARQVGGDAAALLVHVVRLRRHVLVVAAEDQRVCAGRHA